VVLGETPVINGQGLIKLLFHLPGKKARAFVAEAAEKLVRFIGGDATLIAEIHRNRQIASEDSNSMQAFMADNVAEQNLANPPAETDSRMGNAQHPWIKPNTWIEQQELLRYQVDPEAEAALQRSLAQKREAHAQQLDLLRVKHELSLASYDHKCCDPPATRSVCVNGNTLASAGSGNQRDELKMLIHTDWDVKKPATKHQLVAIFMDRFFKWSSQATDVVMENAIHILFGQVMRYNVLELESVGEQTVAEFHRANSYKYSTDIPTIAFTMISMAKTQFPRSGHKEARRAWGWNLKSPGGIVVALFQCYVSRIFSQEWMLL